MRRPYPCALPVVAAILSTALRANADIEKPPPPPGQQEDPEVADPYTRRPYQPPPPPYYPPPSPPPNYYEPPSTRGGSGAMLAFGVVFTVLAAGSLTAAGVVFATAPNQCGFRGDYYSLREPCIAERRDIAAALAVGGGVSLAVGIPLLVVGRSRRSASNGPTSPYALTVTFGPSPAAALRLAF